jgi:hypothetical protein
MIYFNHLLTSIQSLLLIARMLQDDLQLETTWNLLGTAIRLIERLGLHLMLSPRAEVEDGKHGLMHNIW